MAKVYVVWVGRAPGIYDTWAQCDSQVKGFSGAKYKSFNDKAAAEHAFKNPDHAEPSPPHRPAEGSTRLVPINPPYLTVDAAYSHATKILEWRGVMVNADHTETEVFRSRTYIGGSANVGEFIAVIDGLKYLESKGLSIPIYSDSITAQAWVRNKSHNCTVDLSIPLRSAIDSAFAYLKQPTTQSLLSGCGLLDWKSSEWGDIAADFGRKKGRGIPQASGKPLY